MSRKPRTFFAFLHSHYQVVTTVLCLLAVMAAVSLSHGPIGLDGPLLDILVKARSWMFSPSSSMDESPVVVIALDGRSLAEPEVSPYPRILMAPIWASLLTSLGEAGVKAVGFDLIFSYSANQFSKDYDRPFLQALGLQRNRVVLGRSATTPPAFPYQAALRFDPDSLGMLDLPPDVDGAHRRVPATHPAEKDQNAPSLATALLHRSHSFQMPTELVLAPWQHVEHIPTYALIDVLRCAQQPKVLHQAFHEKIVLIGSTLIEEDRHRSSGIFLNPPATPGPPLGKCGLHTLTASDPHSHTVPGVHLHAEAVNAVATGHVTKTVPQSIMFSLVAVLALGTCTLGLRVSPWMFMVGTGGIMFGLGLGATIALGYDIWLPIALPILSVLFIALFVYGIRYVVEERIRSALKAELMFLGGLPRWIIERMAEGEFHLTPENQSGDVTVMFADLSGFTEMSTLVSSEVLATTTSKYFAVIVQQVEATGGWVSEFRGDCVMAIWGGMVSDPNHALHGVQAACRAAWQVDRLKENAEQRGEMGFGIKIGVNSGPAVFGKIGALKRGTYTASGETINLAARLEHLPRVYNCLVVLGPSTAQLVKDDFVIRELDTLKVKGMAHPITIFEALSDCPAMPNQNELIERYDLALTHYRAGRFTQACEIWTTLAESPLEHIRFGNNHTVLWNPSTIMAKRAQEKLLRPPSGS